jgi:hypothetical protein
MVALVVFLVVVLVLVPFSSSLPLLGRCVVLVVMEVMLVGASLEKKRRIRFRIC